MKMFLRKHGTLPGRLIGRLFKTPLLPEITSFKQHLQYGPGSCSNKTVQEQSLKELVRNPPAKTSTQSSGLFGYPLLATRDSFYQYWFLCEVHCNNLVKQITSSQPSSKTLHLFDDLSNTICIFADSVKFVAENAPDKKTAQAAYVVSANAHNYVEKLNTNLELYLQLKAVAEDRAIVQGLDAEDLVALNSLVLDMELSGIHLPEKVRKAYVNDMADVAEAGAKFVELSHLPVVLTGTIPAALTGGLPQENGKTILPASGSEHVMWNVREYAWPRWYAFDQGRETELQNLLRCRSSMAKSLGFSSFAERELTHTMAGSPQNVRNFLDDLHSELKPEVQTELRHLEYAKADDIRHTSRDLEVYPYCAKYYSRKLNQEYLIKNHEQGEMFLGMLEVGNVVEAMNIFCEEILKISLVPEVPMRGELVNKDVVKLAVYDEVEGLIGYIYADLYERENKEPRTCLHTITCGTKTQVPAVVLQCCFTKKTGDSYSYSFPKLTLDEVTTLFHELGHALHAILGRTKYQHTSGTRGPTDFAEIPSMLLENFISHPEVYYRVISPYIKYDPSHFKYGTEHLFNAPYQALETETSIYHSILDLELHSRAVPNLTTSVAEELFARYSHLSPVAGTAWHHRFAHLNYYGSRYYSYLWSRSIANLIFYNLFYEDPFSEAAGLQLKEFLKRGSGVQYWDSLEQLMGYRLGGEEMVGAIVEPIKRFNRTYLDSQDISRKWW